MHVIGTAGHVDHGKSTLVQALTGINPDRLKEEIEREMTIDLGFAWIKPGDGLEEIGIVDVPGHKDFIENMLAGIGGIDLALLVIAADEGVMPQTQELLAILDLIQVKSGVVALTKVDLVEDPDWLEFVILDISDELTGTVLDGAPIIPVSSVSGQGIERLRRTLFERLQLVTPQQDKGYPRLSIDRVFSLTGFGTVVTGTLTGGRFRVGDVVQIQPASLKARIRGLQTHKTKLQVAHPGSRVAINLSGLDKGSVSRGDVVASPGWLEGTILCDVSYRHLDKIDLPLKHNDEVKLFVGSSEVIARARVLGAKQISPGQNGWLQLALKESVAFSRGDRFILRRPSPSTTIGGGRILDPHPGRKHRRFQSYLINRLKILLEGESIDLLLQTIIKMQPSSKDKAIKSSGIEREIAEKDWSKLVEAGRIIEIDQYVASSDWWDKLFLRAQKILDTFHEDYPLRKGVDREELRSKLNLPAQIYNLVLEEAEKRDRLKVVDNTVFRPSHVIVFSENERKIVDKLLSEMTTAGVNTPTVKDVRMKIGDKLYVALLDMDRLYQVSPEVVYTTSVYQDIVNQIRGYLGKHRKVNAAQVRDLLQTSRKYNETYRRLQRTN